MESTFLGDRCSIIEHNLVFPVCFDLGLPQTLLLRVLGGAEAPRALLVHLGSGRHTVDSEVDHLSGLDNFDDFVSVEKNVFEDLLLALGLGPVLRVRTRVDNAVHVEVEVVHDRIVLLDLLLDRFLFMSAFVQRRSLLKGISIFILAVQIDLIGVKLRLLGLLLLFSSVFLGIHFEVVLGESIDDYFGVADG